MQKQFLAFCVDSCYNSIKDENFNEVLQDSQAFTTVPEALGFFAVTFDYTDFAGNLRDLR